MELFDEKLRHLQEEMARKQKLQKQLADLEKQKAFLESRVEHLMELRDQEQAQAEQLEKDGFLKFFLRIAGKLDEKLSREQREAAEAAVRFDEASRELAELEKTIYDIRLELNGRLYSVEWEYEQTLQKKKAAVRTSNDPRSARILELEEQIGSLKIQKKELDEAIFEGKRALGLAESVLASLSSAENWGTWDALGGDGLVTHAMKYSHLDQAQNQVQSLQTALRRFRSELADVKVSANLTVNIEGFTQFADWFFDGLFADLTVLDRIRSSEAQVNTVRYKIRDALSKLESMKTAGERKMAQLQKEQDELLSQIPM